MKINFTRILVLLFTANSISQTELIAFKSHSGDVDNLNSESFDNLGIPPMGIDTIIILNDSTIVEISSRNWGGVSGFFYRYSC